MDSVARDRLREVAWEQDDPDIDSDLDEGDRIRVEGEEDSSGGLGTSVEEEVGAGSVVEEGVEGAEVGSDEAGARHFGDRPAGDVVEGEVKRVGGDMASGRLDLAEVHMVMEDIVVGPENSAAEPIVSGKIREDILLEMIEGDKLIVPHHTAQRADWEGEGMDPD